MLALIALILFPFVIWHTMKRQKLAKASVAWPTTPGVIATSGTAKVVFRTQPRVTYTYEKDGKTHTGNLISFANAVPRAEVEMLLGRYPVGQPVTVHYSPENPAIAVLETGASKQLTTEILYCSIVMAVLIALQFLNFAVRYWMPSGEESKPRTYGDTVAGNPGPTVDPQVVDKNIRDAAEKGQATEQFTLGVWYLMGEEGMPKDPAEAAKWFSKSAAQGNPNAESMLGNLYMKGTGVDKDEAQGVDWFQKAAAQGQPQACFGLGVIYEKGLGGMPKDASKAIEWYKKAGDVAPAKAALERLNAGH